MRTTVIGNLTADPELRFTPSGAAVVNFTIAENKRVKKGDEWVDGDPAFINVQVWREQAEHLAESLRKGMRVMAVGEFAPRNYETREGERRTVWELTADEVGPSLRWQTAQVARAQRQGGGGQQQRQAQPPSGDPWGGQQQPPPSGDPWGGQTAPSAPPAQPTGGDPWAPAH